MTEIQRLLLRNMKKYRSRLNYSQMKLAELCGVSTSFIGEIEIGRKYPSARTLEKIVKALEVQPYKLFMDTDNIDYFDKKGLLDSFAERLHGQIASELETVYLEFDVDQKK